MANGEEDDPPLFRNIQKRLVNSDIGKRIFLNMVEKIARGRDNDPKLEEEETEMSIS